MMSISEAQRLQRLHALGILDHSDNRLLRGLAEQALALLPGTSIAAVTLVDADRQLFKAVVGSIVKETARSSSFCTHTIETSGAMVIEDALLDSRFVGNPMVTASPGVRFYAGIRLMDGVGALCVIGQRPRRASDNEMAKLARLAQCVDIQLLAHGTLFNLGGASGARQPAKASAR